MKKIVLIEDMPWRVRNYLKIVRDELKIPIETIVFFQAKQSKEKKCKDIIGEMEREFQIEIKNANRLNLYDVLEEYYTNREVVILMDFDLKDTEPFFERINIQYALNKLDKGKGRIWFYTSGDRTQKSMLLNNFNNQVVDVIKSENNQLYLDDSVLLEIAHADEKKE